MRLLITAGSLKLFVGVGACADVKRDTVSWGIQITGHWDARLCMFYKVYHRLIAVPGPGDDLLLKSRALKNNHSLVFHTLSTSANYRKYAFFPRTIDSLMELLPPPPRLPWLQILSFSEAVWELWTTQFPSSHTTVFTTHNLYIYSEFSFKPAHNDTLVNTPVKLL